MQAAAAAPATPPGATQARSPSGSPDDYEEELSFDYVWDSNGDFVRVSKGRASTSSTQTSPASDRGGQALPEQPVKEESQAAPQVFLNLNSPARPTTLSRSESASTVMTGGGVPQVTEDGYLQQQPRLQARTLSRIASGPVAIERGVAGLSINKSSGPRRVLMDNGDFGEQRQEQDDKENASGADDDIPHVDLPPTRLRGGPPVRDPRFPVANHGQPSISANGRPLTDLVPAPQRNAAARIAARNAQGRSVKGGSLGSKQVGFGGVSELPADADYGAETDPGTCPSLLRNVHIS